MFSDHSVELCYFAAVQRRRTKIVTCPSFALQDFTFICLLAHLIDKI